MSITLDGTNGITTPDVDSTNDSIINGVTVGRGAGAVANNTAVGYQALSANTTGAQLTAVGTNAGFTNTTGADNTFIGYSAGYSNNTGSYNTVLGKEALAYNTTASYNTAVGFQAGYSNTTGYDNTFVGYYSGQGDTTGYRNTFVGNSSGYYITTGAANTVLGRYNGNQGGLDIRTANNNIVLSDGDGEPKLRISDKYATYLRNGTAWLGAYTQTITFQYTSAAGASPQTFNLGTWSGYDGTYGQALAVVKGPLVYATAGTNIGYFEGFAVQRRANSGTAWSSLYGTPISNSGGGGLSIPTTYWSGAGLYMDVPTYIGFSITVEVTIFSGTFVPNSY